MTPIPVVRGAMQSRDLGEVQELMSRRYVEHRTRVVGSAERFVFRSASAAAGPLTVDQLTYQAGMAMVVQPFTSLVVVSLLDGQIGVTAGRRHALAGRGEALLYPPHVGLDLLMDRMTYQVLQLPLSTVTRLAARAGVAEADFRFEAMTATTPAGNRQWLATIAYLTRLLAGSDQSGIPALLLDAAIDTVATATLSVFPNTTMTRGYTPGPGQIAPAAIRRAVAFIDAHGADPITLDQIATAAGLSSRALQAGFRRHYETTPTGYLLKVRLEHAHRDLQAADRTTGATVAGIARRWGFADHSRFTAAYRAAYGQLPSHTLRT
ncbi:AraC family transcriptional regulator [Actinoplanes philippinensis]|uniref:AraC family transcriptional regulator n=1 Tax=Actinoplanes philippinensis TaxID=35752 RepID=UPI001160A550|nr:AraC family transcriptional regulator [Actinoplanes philippinensis]